MIAQIRLAMQFVGFLWETAHALIFRVEACAHSFPVDPQKKGAGRNGRICGDDKQLVCLAGPGALDKFQSDFLVCRVNDNQRPGAVLVLVSAISGLLIIGTGLVAHVPR